MGKNSCASGICSDNRNFWYHLAFTVLLYLYCPDTFFCRWCMCFASTSVYKSVYCGSVIIQKSCLLSLCVQVSYDKFVVHVSTDYHCRSKCMEAAMNRYASVSQNRVMYPIIIRRYIRSLSFSSDVCSI